jgi:hypothetical protein
MSVRIVLVAPSAYNCNQRLGRVIVIRLRPPDDQDNSDTADRTDCPVANQEYH